jgi:hypothetical protein
MWLQWFGEQSEAVKLALIGLVSAFGAGVFGIVKEWRKPVLDARPAPPPKSVQGGEDPIELLTNAQEATNFALAEIRSEQNHANDRLIDQLEKINDELRNIRQEVVVAREVYAKRG